MYNIPAFLLADPNFPVGVPQDLPPELWDAILERMGPYDQAAFARVALRARKIVNGYKPSPLYPPLNYFAPATQSTFTVTDAFANLDHPEQPFIRSRQAISIPHDLHHSSLIIWSQSSIYFFTFPNHPCGMPAELTTKKIGIQNGKIITLCALHPHKRAFLIFCDDIINPIQLYYDDNSARQESITLFSSIIGERHNFLSEINKCKGKITINTSRYQENKYLVMVRVPKDGNENSTLFLSVELDTFTIRFIDTNNELWTQNTSFGSLLISQACVYACDTGKKAYQRVRYDPAANKFLWSQDSIPYQEFNYTQPLPDNITLMDSFPVSTYHPIIKCLKNGEPFIGIFKQSYPDENPDEILRRFYLEKNYLIALGSGITTFTRIQNIENFKTKNQLIFQGQCIDIHSMPPKPPTIVRLCNGQFVAIRSHFGINNSLKLELELYMFPFH